MDYLEEVLKEEKEELDIMEVCMVCGKEATRLDVDPYLEDLHPDRELEQEWWCEECYHSRQDDI